MKKLGVTAAIAAGLGLATFIAFVGISGLEYWMVEQSGAQPGYTSIWIVAGMAVGALILAGGAVLGIGLAVAALVRGGPRLGSSRR